MRNKDCKGLRGEVKGCINATQSHYHTDQVACIASNTTKKIDIDLFSVRPLCYSNQNNPFVPNKCSE